MPDYKELYLTTIRASEQAIRALVRAQQECEDAILDEADEPESPAPEQQKDRT